MNYGQSSCEKDTWSNKHAVVSININNTVCKIYGKDEGLRKLDITCQSIFTIRKTLWKFLGNVIGKEDLKNLTFKRHNEGKR